MSANALLEAALLYAARGWHVLPCLPGAKLPLTGHGWKDATIDPVVIEKWWKEHPDGNVAVATGPSSVVVLDVDGRHGGLGALSELEEQFQILRAAPRVKTADGYHIWFAGSVRSKTTGRPGLEIKSLGRYVLVPPSIHPDGPIYSWVEELNGEPLPPFPADLAIRWKPIKQKPTGWAEKALASEITLLTSTSKGRRNEQLNRSAFSLGQIMGAGHLDRARVEAALVAAAAANGYLDDDGEEAAQATIRSGLDAGAEKPREPKQKIAGGTGGRPERRQKAPKGAEANPEAKPEPQILRDIEPWADAVAGAEMANEMEQVVQRFVVLPPHAGVAIALWVIHAHAHDAFEISPILAIQSPTKRCGKTRLEQVIAALVPRPLMTSNLSSAVLYRGADAFRPTLLVDEGDSFLKLNEELRGIINSGHSRSGAQVLRCAEPKFELRVFSTWCPKVIALIGRLPSTIEDRSVVIPLHRKRRDEAVARLRGDRVQHELEPLRRKAARWAQDHMEHLTAEDPGIPTSLNDRAADNWRPLIAIADLLGDGWPEKARRAAVALSGAPDDTDEAGEQLIADLQTIFETHGEKLSSEEIVRLLKALPERPWGEWSDGRGFTQRALATLLKGFGLESRNVKFADGKVKKGYHRDQFTDVFSRYTPQSQTSSRYSATDREFIDQTGNLVSATEANGSGDKNAVSTSNDAGGSGVADWNPSLGGVQDGGDPPTVWCDLPAGVVAAIQGAGWELVEGVEFPSEADEDPPSARAPAGGARSRGAGGRGPGDTHVH